jgi:hypothetical protein
MPIANNDLISISRLKHDLLQIFGQTFIFLTFAFVICIVNIKNVNIPLICNIYCFSIIIISIIFGKIAELLKN